MRLLFYFFALCLFVSLFSCTEIVESVVKENADENHRLDSLALIDEEEKPLQGSNLVSDKYDVIERSKIGNDSVYRVRSYYWTGEKFGEQTFRSGKQEGISVFFHKNGKVFCKIKCSNNYYDEILEVKNKKGKDLERGSYKNGNGKLIIYNPETEEIDFEMTFKDRKRHGEFKYYYSTGQLKAKGSYTNDSINGPINIFFKNGNMRETANYMNGKKDGKQIQFYANGKFKRLEIWKNKLPESISEFNRRGQLTMSATPNATKKIDYFPDGSVLSQSTLVNGLKEGTFTYYHENKKLKSEEIWTRDTLKSDKQWYENGKLRSESTYKNNEKSGIYKEYYANGNIRQVAEYANGKQNGKTTSYYGNGKLYFEGNYVDDKPFGKFDYYKEDGTFKGSNVFK